MLTPHTDGTPDRYTEADAESERAARAILERAWQCRIAPVGRMAQVDWFCLRHERPVAVCEVKTRSHASAKYDTVFLNVRKWLALMLLSFGMGVPAVFAVQFTDGIRWIDLAHVDPRRWKMGGCARVHTSHTDVEPVIEVPVAAMIAVGAL